MTSPGGPADQGINLATCRDGGRRNVSWTGRRKAKYGARSQRPGIHPGCVSSRPTIRHGKGLHSTYVLYVHTVSSDRDDRRQVPSGEKIAPDCAEDQPPSHCLLGPLWVCGQGRHRRHVRGVHKNGSQL